MNFVSLYNAYFRDYSLAISIDHKREPQTCVWRGITYYFPYYIAEWRVKDAKYACSVPPAISTWGRRDRPSEDLDKMYQYLEQKVKESERDYDQIQNWPT